jgi:hypothetical protein
MNLSKEETSRILGSAKHAREEIYCAEHQFFPGKPTFGLKNDNQPALGCKSCSMARLMYDFATTPPHLRAERVAQLESLVPKLVKEVERLGKIDFEFYEHPQIQIENDGQD